MIFNYIKTALRNMWRSKAYSAITILGFSVGIASFLLIATWIRWELSYDRFHKQADRIYFLNPEVYWGGEWRRVGMTPASYGYHMKRDIPQLEATVRLRPFGRDVFKLANGKKFVQACWFADSSFFQVFSVDLLQGVPGSALAEPNQVVLSQSVAQKFFGTENPVGQTIEHEGEGAYTVVGVFEDLPENSHRDVEFMISMPTAIEGRLNGVDPESRWDTDFNYYTYVLLREGVQPTELAPVFPGFFEGHMGEMAERVKLHMTPLTDMHLNGDHSRIIIASAIALFILALACINFMNLATARSAGRSREIGVRKTLGGTHSHLVFQFLGESLITTLLALILALILAQAALPYFNQVAGVSLSIDYLEHPLMLLALLGGALLVGVVAGLYPALYLASFRPATVLKPGGTRPRSRAGLRRLLVVFQFVITIVMVIGTVTVFRQLDYLQSRELGFDEENLVYITLFGSELPEQAFDLKEEALQIPGVQQATVLSRLVGAITGGIWSIRTPETPPEESLPLHAVFADGDYLETFGLDLVWGRNYNDEVAEEREQSFLLNEAAIEAVNMDPDQDNRLVFNGVEGRVVGVLKDFHYKSLHSESDPIIFKYPRNTMFDQRYIAVRLAPGDPGSALEALEELWKRFDPNLDFEYRFADAMIDRLYRSEARTGKLLSGFSLIAIVIALLGMVGMAIYVTTQRTKEIGIRKVLGASVANLLGLLSWDFAKPVLIANLIAWPVVWILMTRWLENFAFRTELTLASFLIAGASVLLLALLAVIAQVLRTVRANPVETLHYE